MAINFPLNPTVNQVYTYGNRTWTFTGYGWQATTTSLGPQGIQGLQGPAGASAAALDITILDNLRPLFNNFDKIFTPTYEGNPVSITNPGLLEVYLNGVKQKVLMSTPTWMSYFVAEPATIAVNNDGNIAWTSAPAAGSMFEGIIVVGATTTSNTTNYPFAPMDLMMGAL